jgi:hypothetical protein
MDNHLHVLLRVDPDIARDWSEQEVASRWLQLYPPRDVKRKPIASTQDMIQKLAENTAWVQTARERLSSLSWFMKCLKEPLSRMANKQDNCKGTFFEARFKSIAILDEEALLTVAAYIDLNPVAAGVAPLPESSPHTSIKERVDHVIAAGKLDNVEAIRNGSVAAQQVSEGVEDHCWLIPIEDQRSRGGKREGFKEGFTLGQYLMLVDCTSRAVRDAKQSVSVDLESIFDRLAENAGTGIALCRSDSKFATIQPLGSTFPLPSFRRYAMTIARSRIVDLQSIRWYHCISRCVRKSFLLANEVHD